MALSYYKPAIALIILSAAFFMYGGEYANAAAECTPACGILERCQEPGICVPIASAQANAPTPGSEGSFFSCKNPIVPCGREGTPECNLCYLYNLAGNVVNFCLFCLILPIAVVALLLGGIFLLASRGNPQMLEWGKTAMVNVVIGVIIAFAAWLIIATIINTLGYGGFTAAWNVPPQCQTPLITQQTGDGTGSPSPPPSTPPAFQCVCTDPDPNTHFETTVADCSTCESFCQQNAGTSMESCGPTQTGTNRFCYVANGVGGEPACVEFPTETECQAGDADGCASLDGTCQASCEPPPPPPPPGTGTLTHQEAEQQLSDAGITVSSTGNCSNKNNSSCTSLDGIQQSTISGIIAFKQECDCPVNISGGTEVGHAPGVCSHGNGCKIDVSLNGALNTYVADNYENIGQCFPQASVCYQSPSGDIWARESNHWDVAFP